MSRGCLQNGTFLSVRLVLPAHVHCAGHFAYTRTFALWSRHGSYVGLFFFLHRVRAFCCSPDLKASLRTRCYDGNK